MKTTEKCIVSTNYDFQNYKIWKLSHDLKQLTDLYLKLISFNLSLLKLLFGLSERKRKHKIFHENTLDFAFRKSFYDNHSKDHCKKIIGNLGSIIWLNYYYNDNTSQYLDIGPTQVKCRLLISSIFYAMNFWHFWKCWNLIYGISEKCRKFIA